MTMGLFGYSIVLELLVLYYAFHLLWPNTPKRWVVLGIGIVALFVLARSSQLAGLFSGSSYSMWDEVLRTFRL